MNPARASPRPIWISPARTTANRNAGNDPSDTIWAATIAVKPAAGPLTLVCDPLNIPTTMPPTIPASTPENNGAPDASAIPRHKGSATRNTTRPAVRSRGRVDDDRLFVGNMIDNAPCAKPTNFKAARFGKTPPHTQRWRRELPAGSGTGAFHEQLRFHGWLRSSRPPHYLSNCRLRLYSGQFMRVI